MSGRLMGDIKRPLSANPVKPCNDRSGPGTDFSKFCRIPATTGRPPQSAVESRSASYRQRPDGDLPRSGASCEEVVLQMK